MTTAPVSRRLSEDYRADLLVALVVALALAAGWLFKSSLTSRTTVVTDPNSQFKAAIPSYWSTRESDSADTFLAAENPNAPSTFKSSVLGQSFLLDPENPTALDALVDRLVQQHGDTLIGYHLLDIRAQNVAGAEARVVEYAYIVQPIDQPFRASVPVVVHATDTLIYTPKEYWLLTLAADERLYAKEQPNFDRIVASVQLP